MGRPCFAIADGGGRLGYYAVIMSGAVIDWKEQDWDDLVPRLLLHWLMERQQSLLWMS